MEGALRTTHAIPFENYEEGRFISYCGCYIPPEDVDDVDPTCVVCIDLRQVAQRE